MRLLAGFTAGGESNAQHHHDVPVLVETDGMKY
jgi:hypothetical protein